MIFLVHDLEFQINVFQWLCNRIFNFRTVNIILFVDCLLLIPLVFLQILINNSQKYS